MRDDFIQHNHKTHNMVDTILPTKQPKTILDVACGHGIWGLHFRFRYPKATIIGIEKDPHYIQTLIKTRLYHTLIQHDLTNLPLPISRNYDLIFAGEIIEHLQKREAVNLIKHLKFHTDKLILTTPNNELHDIKPTEHPNRNMHHKSTWTPKQLHKLGFKTKIITPPNYITSRMWKLYNFMKNSAKLKHGAKGNILAWNY